MREVAREIDDHALLVGEVHRVADVSGHWSLSFRAGGADRRSLDQ
ncbi:hypothetical protein [Egicoccus sp. AB-alg2]